MILTDVQKMGKRAKRRKCLELLSHQSRFGLGWCQWGWREGGGFETIWMSCLYTEVGGSGGKAGIILVPAVLQNYSVKEVKGLWVTIVYKHQSRSPPKSSLLDLPSELCLKAEKRLSRNSFSHEL